LSFDNAAISHLGIMRGKPKQKAKYQDIRQFYADVNQAAEEKRQDWAIDVAQIALLARLEQGQDIQGQKYSITLKGTTLQVNNQERGLLVEQNLDTNQVQATQSLQESDLDYFKKAEREDRLRKIQRAQRAQERRQHQTRYGL
jgi:hypothetical protein